MYVVCDIAIQTIQRQSRIQRNKWWQTWSLLPPNTFDWVVVLFTGSLQYQKSKNMFNLFIHDLFHVRWMSLSSNPIDWHVSLSFCACVFRAGTSLEIPSHESRMQFIAASEQQCSGWSRWMVTMEKVSNEPLNMPSPSSLTKSKPRHFRDAYYANKSPSLSSSSPLSSWIYNNKDIHIWISQVCLYYIVVYGSTKQIHANLPPPHTLWASQKGNVVECHLENSRISLTQWSSRV